MLTTAGTGQRSGVPLQSPPYRHQPHTLSVNTHSPQLTKVIDNVIPLPSNEDIPGGIITVIDGQCTFTSSKWNTDFHTHKTEISHYMPKEESQSNNTPEEWTSNGRPSMTESRSVMAAVMSHWYIVPATTSRASTSSENISPLAEKEQL